MGPIVAVPADDEHPGWGPVFRRLTATALASVALVAGWTAIERLRHPTPWLGGIDPLLRDLQHWHQPGIVIALAAVSAVLGVAAWAYAAAAAGSRAWVALLVAALGIAAANWVGHEVTLASMGFAAVVVVAAIGFAFSAGSPGCGLGHRTWNAARRVVQRETDRWDVAWIAWAGLALGVVFRIHAVLAFDIWSDGALYVGMAHGWLEHGDFIMPYAESSTTAALPPSPAHHFPPLYPFLLGLTYKVFGFGVAQTHAFDLVVALVMLGVVYACSRDLYGHRAALAVTAILALDPQSILLTGTNFSDNLAIALFAATLWAILRSLDDARFMLWGGAAAALAYLTRSSMGTLFLIAGLAGFAWRFLYRKWTVFRDLNYLGAATIFGATVAWWAGRNIRTFGGWPAWQWPWDRVEGGTFLQSALQVPSARLAALGAALGLLAMLWWGRPRPGLVPAQGIAARGRRYWILGVTGMLFSAGVALWLAANLKLHGEPPWQTSAYNLYAFDFAKDHPELWHRAMAWKATFVLVLLLVPLGLVLLGPLVTAARRWREERVSGLLLAVVLATGITWWMTAAFWPFERSSMFWLDNRRYLLIAFVPLSWLAFGAAREDRTTALRLALLVSIFAVAAAHSALHPVDEVADDAAAALAGRLEPGMTLAVDGLNKYLTYPYLPEHNITTYIIYRNDDGGWFGPSPHYIISRRSGTEGPTPYPGFHLLGHWEKTDWLGRTLNGELWERDSLSTQAVGPSP